MADLLEGGGYHVEKLGGGWLDRRLIADRKSGGEISPKAPIGEFGGSLPKSAIWGDVPQKQKLGSNSPKTEFGNTVVA